MTHEPQGQGPVGQSAWEESTPQPTGQPVSGTELDPGALAAPPLSARLTPPGVSEAYCPTCGAWQSAPGAWHAARSARALRQVWAIGRIEPRFATLAVEKEFAQQVGDGDLAGTPDMALLHEVLPRPENRYLARRMCWVLTTVAGDAFAIDPRDGEDVDLLTGTLAHEPDAGVADIVVGSAVPPGAASCQGLGLPAVAIDQLHSFPVAEFVAGVPMPEGGDEQVFRMAARDLFERVRRRSGNAGIDDEHRALNYVAVRYPAVYALVAEAYGADKSLHAIETRRADSGGRSLVDIRLVFRSRRTDVIDRHHCRVDVTEVFPFLDSRLEVTYD